MDIGGGSGIYSLCLHMLGAKSVESLDADPRSVASARILWKKAGKPANWKIGPGSILDQEFVAGLGQHDIVYSWGVLHHTGAIWEAMENACSLVAPGGLLWISIYTKGPRYPKDLALKQSYNRASFIGKKIMIWKEIYKMMRLLFSWRQNPFAWNVPTGRGMDTYHDLVDW